MINALIKNGDRSTIISMPAGRREMAEKLYHIGINTPADKISCRGLSDPPINVELNGDTDMETKLIAVLTEWDTVGGLNGVLSRFYALPMQNRQECEVEVLADGVANLPRFCECLSKHLPSEIEVKYYCPLKVMLYERNEYGDIDESLYSELAGSFADSYEDEIRERLHQYNNDGIDMAEYFSGSNGVTGKLKSAEWDFESHGGTLYGCIKVKLTAPFTPEEETEFKEWIRGQNSDGLGEGFEQQEIDISDGEMYVSYWHSGNDYYIDNETEFDYRLSGDIGMGGM